MIVKGRAYDTNQMDMYFKPCAGLPALSPSERRHWTNNNTKGKPELINFTILQPYDIGILFAIIT